MSENSTSRHFENLRNEFTACMRRVPGAVGIIASSSGNERRGLVATAWCSLSADPPMVLVCVNQNASAHEFIASSGYFSVNQLGTEHANAVAVFSGQAGLKGSDRFARDQWEADCNGVPVFKDALVHFVCKLVESHIYGTHSIFVGKVISIGMRPEGSPLVYLERGLVQTASI